MTQKFTLSLFFLFIFTLKPVLGQKNLPYKNSKLPVEERVKDLLARMTIEEKAGQLSQLNGGVFTGPALHDPGQKAKMEDVRNGKVGSMLNVSGSTETRAIQKIAAEETRLGIPLLFGFDVIHGYKTIFPVPLAEACSWDLDLMEKTCAIAAKEAAAAGLHWTFAPMCDISDDPRWGRVMEGAGEDPWLGAKVAAARVKGFQGNLNDEAHVMACVKHFAGYGAVQSGREYNYVDMSRQQLWNKHMPPYKAAIEAGAASVMNGFNTFEGVPVTGNPYLVRNILRNQWGYKGVVVSDWQSFEEMIAWGHAENKKDAVAKAINAGSMIDMESKAAVEFIPELVSEGKISIEDVNEAVRRILRIKFQLGLFDNPYRFSDPTREKESIFTPEHKKVALESAKKSIVLLKNQDQLLPIKQGSKKIALCGVFAASQEDLSDFWIAKGDKNDITLWEALKDQFPGMRYSKGFHADGKSDQKLIDEAVAQAQMADVVLVNIGISGKLAGEDRAVARPEIPENQLALVKALHATGKPVIALVYGGRPLVLTQIEPLATAILQVWLLGTETGPAIAEVLTGAYNPSGKTVMTFPYDVGQIPISYNYFNTGRPLQPTGDGSWRSRYRDIPNEPLYPFGYGLSYTSFEYKDQKTSQISTRKGGSVTASVTITNTGKTEGEEVVQLYIRDHTASIVRPMKELKGFEKIRLKPGETRMVSFTLTDKELSFFDAEGNPVLESGKFSVFIGPNSRDCFELGLELK